MVSELWLVILIYASPSADMPETVVRVPMHGAQIEHCIALGSAIEAQTQPGGKPWRVECETLTQEAAI